MILIQNMHHSLLAVFIIILFLFILIFKIIINFIIVMNYQIYQEEFNLFILIFQFLLLIIPF